MLASIALFALLGLPVLLGVLQRVAGQIADVRPQILRAVLATGIVGSIGVLGAAWVWRWVNVGGAGDVVVGGWTVVSFSGTPLTVGGAMAGSVAVIALAAVRVVQLLAPDLTLRNESSASHGVLMLGAALAMLGESTPTLLVGLGLMIIAGFWNAAHNAASDAAIRAFAVQIIAVLIAGMVFAVGGNANADHRLEAAAPLEHSLLSFLLNVAAALHANLLPFGSLRGSTSNAQSTAGMFGAAALLSHADSVEPWLPALAALTCVFWSIRALVASDASTCHVRLRDAAGAFGLAIGMHAPEATVAGWVLGVALLQMPGIARIAAVPVLLAFPGSIGFAAAATAPPVTDIVMLGIKILCTGSASVLGFALLRHALVVGDLATLRSSLRSSLRMRQLPSITIAGTHALVLGAAPSLAGMPTLAILFGNTPTSHWISLALGVAVAVALWRISGDADLEPIDAVSAGFTTVLQPFFAALNRISTSIGALLPLLESDGALLLTCLVLVVAVLTFGQSTP